MTSSERRQRLVVATQNVGKIAEIRTILQELPYAVIPVADIVPDFFVEEDGATYQANAVKKARSAADRTGMVALADDSGLEVDALDGAPGVYSARFGGGSLSQAEKNALLLRKLEGIEARTARFRCVIAIVTPGGQVRTSEGVCEGMIGDEARGDQGFGYDPLFVLPAYGKTMAQVGQAVKNSISHRACALAGVPELLNQMRDEGGF